MLLRIKKRFYASLLGDQKVSSRTSYFVKALQEAYPTHKVLLFLTEAASKKHKKDLLDEDFEIQIIKDGATENEIWEIFQTVTSSYREGESLIPEGSEVIFDVTNGYRHLPMIILSIAVFLQKVRGIKVPHIYYGAFDAKQNEETPLFDLAPFMKIMDWSWAAEHMIRTGDPKELGKSLREINIPNLDKSAVGGFNKLAAVFESISRAENMIRPKELSERVKKLGNLVCEAENIAAKYPAYLPLNEILNKVSQRLDMFLDYSDDWETKEGMIALAGLARFYHEKEKYVHAVILTSELIVTLFCMKNGKGDSYGKRDEKRDGVSN